MNRSVCGRINDRMYLVANILGDLVTDTERERENCEIHIRGELQCATLDLTVL